MLQSLLFQSSSDNVSKGFHRTALMILFSRATDLEVTGRISTQQQSVCCGDALFNFNFNWASHVEAPHNSCSEHDFCDSKTAGSHHSSIFTFCEAFCICRPWEEC